MKLSKNQFVLRRSYQHPGEGNTITHEIDKGGFVHEVLVVMRGLVNVTGGTTNGAANGQYNPFNAVNQFEVIANPKDGSPYPGGTLKRVLARSVAARQIFDCGRFLGDNLNATIAATGASTVESCFLLRFSVPEFMKSAETSLYTDAYSALQLIITLGGKSSLYTGNDRNWDWSGVTFDVYDRRSSASPNYQDVAVLFERDVIVPINGANDSFNLKDYLAKEQPYYDILAISETTAAGTLTDGIINKVKLVEDMSGTPFLREVKPGVLRYLEKQRFDSDAASTTGLLRIPVAQDGMLRQCVSSPSLVLDVANPGGANLDRIILNTRCVMLPEDFIPGLKAAKAARK